MTLTAGLLVLLGGALGAPTRWIADAWVKERSTGDLPWGTFAVNIVGTFILGLIASLTAHQVSEPWLLTLIGTGFCGALTTFSTFSVETVRLIEGGRAWVAARYVIGSLVLGALACLAGWGLGALIG
ncbi:fluoride efflux transporter CrcB [Dermacoccaceae bacterium W4C1]